MKNKYLCEFVCRTKIRITANSVAPQTKRGAIATMAASAWTAVRTT